MTAAVLEAEAVALENEAATLDAEKEAGLEADEEAKLDAEEDTELEEEPALDEEWDWD